MTTPHPHKHQATITAWAAGAQIQCRLDCSDTWVDTCNPAWELAHHYRVKHKHQDCIDAWERGEDVQVNNGRCSGEWLTMDREPPEPAWLEGLNYRIKPKPHKHQVAIAAFAAGKKVQWSFPLFCVWQDTMDPQWDHPGLLFRIKPEALKSRRYVFNRADKPTVGICTPQTHLSVAGDTFVRWIDEDWVETDV